MLHKLNLTSKWVGIFIEKFCTKENRVCNVQISQNRMEAHTFDSELVQLSKRIFTMNASNSIPRKKERGDVKCFHNKLMTDYQS